MFNGYHDPSAISYNDFELERGKKNQSASKWSCGNGSSIQSQLHSQNQQSEIWVSKPPFVELPSASSQKCSCPSCYQLPESQSYQGEIPWHRSWFSRTYPVTVNTTHDLVKLPANHHWENAAGFGSESCTEPVGGQFVQESGEKSLYYEPYSGVRHEIYQPGIISTMKKMSRKQDLPKQDEVINVGPHQRYSMSNPSYDPFRTNADQRLIEERTNYCNKNEKFINAESCRQQVGVGPYGLNSNHRTILESFSKTVPLNPNQNRVPSAEHHSTKDNDFHTYTDQNNIEKSGPHINHAGAEGKHCKSYFQSDINPWQENLHTGLMNVFSSTAVDYHGMNLNRQLPDATAKDFQKFINGRNPQYFPRSNISDMINRNSNSVLNYNFNRKGVINVPSGSMRAAQNPIKHAEMVSKTSNFGKDCLIPDKMLPEQKLIIKNNSKMPMDRFHKGSEIPKSDNILHGHITRPVMDANSTDKVYNCVPSQENVYKGCGRPQEHSYGHREIQKPNDYPNGMITVKSDLPMGINIGMANFPDLRKGMDAYPRVNPYPNDETAHQLEKLHYHMTGDNKLQSSIFCGSQIPPRPENFRITEKENPGKISHLEAIPYEELCKNGSSKISPLRLLRKKKLIHQKKEEVNEAVAADVVTNSKTTSPPLDVRRFWATWAEEEEENVLQTQMVVLDCHDIDPEQAGLLHLYNPENIRTVNLEDENVLEMKDTHFEKRNDQIVSVNGRTSDLDEKPTIFPESDKVEVITRNEVIIPVKSTNIVKSQSHPEFTLNAPLIVDKIKESTPDREMEANATHFGKIEQNQSLDSAKQSESLRLKETKRDDSHKENYSNIEKPVLNKTGNSPLMSNGRKIDSKRESEGNGFHVGKDESLCSDSSDESQIENIPALPDLPTSEYRKNKFLDYSDDNFCNGNFSLESVTSSLNKESPDRKQKGENDCHDEDKLKDFLTSEIGPGTFEIDDILRKLSDINFQGTDIGTESPVVDDSPEKQKTDKKILESRTEKKIKKLSHKSSRTDQVTLQNISLTKPTIKFSIQKSHDLKISFKVLNNKKKHEEKEDNSLSYGDVQEDHSADHFMDREVAERLKKNKRRLITLKLKGVSDGNEEGSSWEEDSGRKNKKSLKKKKIRLDRSPSPKAPVLKIKKSRYMLTYGCESGEVPEEDIEDANDASESKESSHGDFQVHETVDSAKIRLTFKRNRNGKEKCGENDDTMDTSIKSSHFENEPAGEIGFYVKSINEKANLVEPPKDSGILARTGSFEDIQEESNEGVSSCSIDKSEGDTKIDPSDESDPITTTCSRSFSDSESVELLCNSEELMIDDFKKEDMAVDPLGLVETSTPEDLSLIEGIHIRGPSEMEKYDPSVDLEKELPEAEMNSLNLGIEELPSDENYDAVEKNSEELPNPRNKCESSNIVSRLDLVTENIEISGIKLKEEDYTENRLNYMIRESSNNSLEIVTEKGYGEIVEKVEGKHGIIVKSPVTSSTEEEKLDTREEQCLDIDKQEDENFIFHTKENVNENIHHQSSVSSLDNKVEEFDSVEQLEYQGISGATHFDTKEKENDADEPVTNSNSICDFDSIKEVTQAVTGWDLVEQIPAVSSSSEQSKTEIDSELIESHDCHRELEKFCISEAINKSENSDSGILMDFTDKTNNCSIDINAVHMEVEQCGIEQNAPGLNESTTKETINKDCCTKEKNSSHIGVSLVEGTENDYVKEENNNEVKLYPKEVVFVSRKILRRHSDDDAVRKPRTNTKRMTGRSTSLSVRLTPVDFIEQDVPVLDIAISDIPLPPGEAPPENCLNLEEYFKSKILEIEKKVIAPDSAEISPLVFNNLKPLEMVQSDLLQETKPFEPVREDGIHCDLVSLNLEGQEQLPSASPTKKVEVVNESALGSQQKDLEKSSDAEEITEIRIEDLEVFETKDADISLEESTFRTEQLFECEGLAFDEALTITDDVEEVKVSDDDKFRDIMQNCLDNAKKFLSVGNVKLPLSSVDDTETDNESEAKDLHSEVSKNISITSCAVKDEVILSNNRHQPLEMPVDFVPSLCMDVDSNPCSEILPVDNWPYLEEEVASSPVRNKTEDSDFVCYSDPTSSVKNMILECKPSMGKAKPSRRFLHGDFDVSGKTGSIVERRRTIEGVGRWGAFRSTDEELSDVENFVLKTDARVKRSSTELIRYSRKQMYHKNLKKRIKPYSDGEGNEVNKRKSTFKRCSAYYKSSSWQPKVVLFRISTNNMENLSVLPTKSSSELSSLAFCKRAGTTVDQNWKVTNREETNSSIPSRRVRDYHFEDDIENAKNMNREKPGGNRADGSRRKKSRFRNLHTKKRKVPELSDQTKENKSAADNSSNLVDTESDSDEDSPTRHPPKEIVLSHNKSTKSSSSADGVPNRKHKMDEEHFRNRKYDHETNSVRYKEKRKRDSHDSKHEMECQYKRNHSEKNKLVEDGESSTSDNNMKLRRETNKKFWVCEVCGFSKTSERMSHIQSHPFHCQSCHLAFKTEANFVEHLTRKHKDIRNQHHCLLCELSFDMEKDYYHHLETREHKHLEYVEKNTINTLFRLLIGQPCPVLGPVESKPEWLPSQAGTVHFYHQATPLSLALQYLKLHHDRKKISTGALSPSE